MKKILLTYPVPAQTLDQFTKDFSLTVADHKLSHEEVVSAVKEYNGLFVFGVKADRQVMDAGKKLEVIANFGVGYDNIDWKYATEKGIAVVNTPTQVTDATAEHTLALIISTMRDIAGYDRELRQGVWKTPLFSDRATELTDRTLGVIGFGRIGKAVAKKATGIGMNVIYYDVYRAQPELEKEYKVTYMEFDKVLANSDCITLHMPFTEKNRHLFNLETFRKMKKTAYFINCARGPIVNEKDLARALQEGIIKGAGLDVFENEPHPSPELLQLSNITLTPHVASSTMKARLGMAKEALSGIAAVLKGNIPYNVINPEVLKK
ncbi:MAG: dihydrofolate reductase [Spirochaetia bacterium]|jgi:D-3-phosphoglycerate dehydrogenase|nr:dihydrofolate reductase [Spirochaetia bacterium]